MTDLPSRPEVLTPPDRGVGDQPATTRAVTAERPLPPRPGRSVWTTRVRPVLKHLVLIFAAFIMLYPLLWMIASSFKPDALIFREDRKSTRLNSSHVAISYAVFCLKKKTIVIKVLNHSPIDVATHLVT